MITLKDIYLENFMSISELSMTFEDDTIVAITGKNGSGKSALLYAIAFAFTGYRYGDSYRSYVKTGTDSAHIILNAIFKGYPINYDIEIMSPNKKVTPPVRRKVTYKDKIYLNSEYDQFIKEHKLNEVESLMCIFGDQHNDIINTKPGDRANTLKKIFKIDFSEAVKVFKDKQEEIKIKNIELATKINELNNRIFEKQVLLRTLSKKGLEEKKQQLYDVNLNLSNISNVDEASIKKYTDWLNSTETSLKTERKKLEEEENNKKKYEESIEKSNNLIKDIDEDTIKKEIEALDSEKNKIEEEIEKINNDLKSKSSKASVYTFKVDELKKQVAVCLTGICHACGHEIDKEHTDKIELELKQAIENLDAENELISEDKKKIQDLKDRTKPIIKSISSLNNDLQLKESESHKIELNKARLDNLITSITDRQKNIERLEQDKNRIKTEKEELDKLKPLLEQRKDLENKKKELEELIKKTEADIVRNEEKRLSNLQVGKDQEKRDQAVKDLTNEQNNVALQLGSIKQSIEVFDTLFPNYIILQACAQLEEYINSIIQRMFPYMKVSLKLNRSGVDFYFVAESSSEEWLSVKMASRAQKRSLSLAYQIALAKMYGLNCVLIDEADDSMDPESAKTIYNFISKLEDFQQILFISHRQESLETMMNSNRDNIIMYQVSHGEYEQV